MELKRFFYFLVFIGIYRDSKCCEHWRNSAVFIHIFGIFDLIFSYFAENLFKLLTVVLTIQQPSSIFIDFI